MSTSGRGPIRKDKLNIGEVFEERNAKKAALQARAEAEQKEETVIVTAEPAEPESRGEAEPVKKERAKTKKEPEKSKKTSQAALNIPNKKGHGVAKSVYFDDDNFDYIEEISNDNDIKFSVVMNLIIRQFRDEHKQEN